MSQDVAKFIAVVGLHFPAPKNDDEPEYKAWVASIIHSLHRYDGDVLAAAAQHILETRSPKKDGRFFPAPSECKAACDQQAKLKNIRDDSKHLSFGQDDQSPWASWRVELAHDLLKTEMGRQAAKEGWHLALYNFARTNARLPTGGEIGQCRDTAYSFNEVLDEIKREEWSGPALAIQGSLIELGDKMLAHREELKEMIASGRKP